MKYNYTFKTSIRAKKFNNLIHILIKKDNKVVSKKEIIISKLQNKLGKSREDVTNMVSSNLLSILTMVPFSTEK